MKIPGKKFNTDEASRVRILQNRQQSGKNVRQQVHGNSVRNESNVVISDLARKINALSVPEEDQVRIDKVNKFKSAISEGTYNPDSKAIARKVIEDLSL